MAWKIIFTYGDSSTLNLGGTHKKLPINLAENYMKTYGLGGNDGGMVYISLYKKCKPVLLVDYIKQKKA